MFFYNMTSMHIILTCVMSGTLSIQFYEGMRTLHTERERERVRACVHVFFFTGMWYVKIILGFPYHQHSQKLKWSIQ